MLDSIIAFTQSWPGQTIGLVGCLVFPLFAAIYGSHLNDCGKTSRIANIFLVIFFVAGSIVAIDEDSLMKTIGKGFIYFFVIIIETGFYMDLMKSK
ncbi:MAG: hypothetical protein IKZ45_01965 [Fibrobacter sp.]|nr:hypothetical protein [Fibrobacter sp.]MBR5414259.1 hypothetical protein [Fibrobacter sp.]